MINDHIKKLTVKMLLANVRIQTFAVLCSITYDVRL